MSDRISGPHDGVQAIDRLHEPQRSRRPFPTSRSCEDGEIRLIVRRSAGTTAIAFDEIRRPVRARPRFATTCAALMDIRRVALPEESKCSEQAALLRAATVGPCTTSGRPLRAIRTAKGGGCAP